MKKSLWSLGALMILIGVMAVPTAHAQVPLPESSTWSITEPTLVGDTLLQPGTYRIKSVARDRGRNLVRVMSMDEQTILTTVLTVPHEFAPGEEMPNTMFVFYPAAEGVPRALRTWFPAEPPSGAGHDIVYDEDRAKVLARASKSRVVYYETADLETTEVRVVTPEARVETWVPRVTIVETPPPTIIAERRTELPATGSKTPLIAMLGLLSVAAAFAIRASIR